MSISTLLSMINTELSYMKSSDRSEFYQRFLMDHIREMKILQEDLNRSDGRIDVRKRSLSQISSSQ